MKNLKIAITGGIGSGKTEVLKIVSDLGYNAYSCDDICAEIYKKQSFLAKLERIFPTAVSGKLVLKVNKKVVSALTFNNKENLNKLNALLHPMIIKKLSKKLEKKEGLVFAEVPLLFEGNYQEMFDKVIVVCRDKEERINSVKTRSNLERAQVEKIMNVQVNYDNLDLTNYIVIENDKDVQNLTQKVIDVIEKLKTEE